MLRYKGNKLKDNKPATQTRTVHILQFLIFHYCMQLEIHIFFLITFSNNIFHNVLLVGVLYYAFHCESCFF